MNSRPLSLAPTIAVLLLAGCAAHSLYLFEKPLKSGARTPDGKQQGLWKYWYDPARQHIKAQGRYKDDRQIGTWTYWYESGGREWEGGFKDERLHGMQTFLYENGRMRAQGEFDRGFENGHWTYWNPEGGKYREGDYAQGVLTDQWTCYYADGELLARGEFRDGKKTGTWHFSNQQGEPRAKDFSLAPQDAGARDDGDTLPEPEAWLLAEVDKPLKLPLRAQPWTENDEGYVAFNVGRYRDGRTKVAVPAGWDEEQRPSTQAVRGDRERSDALIGRPLYGYAFKTGEGQDFGLARYKGKKLVLVVLRGMGGEVCVYCVTQTRALAERQDEIAAAGAQIVMVYPGSEERLDAFFEGYRRLLKREDEPPFPFVCDARTELVMALDIQANLALPTTLILDGEGVVRWAYVGVDKVDRPSVTEILEALGKTR